MKTFILKITSIACVALLLSTAMSTSSCKKDKTCHGKVHVVDTTGAAVANAVVNLAAPSVNGDVKYDGTTDGTGDVSFDVALPAIFDVKATSSLYPGRVGTGVLRLDEPGKTGNVTVTLR